MQEPSVEYEYRKTIGMVEHDQRISACSKHIGNSVVREHFYLLGQTGPLAGHKIMIDRNYLLIGRDPKGCHLLIEQAKISRQHAALMIDKEGRVTIIDLDSTNGTYVNCEPVKRRQLKDGDGIDFGRDGIASFIFHRIDSTSDGKQHDQLSN